MMTRVACPYCFEKTKDIFELNFTVFRHFGFVDNREKGLIGECRECQLLFNLLEPGEIEGSDSLYRTLEYAQSGVTNQTFFIRGYEKRVSRSFLQTELLSQSIHTERPAILDIGCFDGTLLREFHLKYETFEKLAALKYPSANLHGFDVNEHLRSLFPSGENFRFWSSTLDEIDETFDLICLSHSMVYIKDIHHLLKCIQKLLKPEGRIFIQVPDIFSNPFAVLLSDQYYYYTLPALEKIFCGIGLRFSPLRNDWFPRDVAGVAERGPFHQDRSLAVLPRVKDCIAQLIKKRLTLDAMSNHARIGVLGTTVAAAFVDSILSGRVFFFADENTDNPGSRFRNKEVIHPSSIEKTDCLVIPYGAASESIKDRFASEYGLTLFETL